VRRKETSPEREIDGGEKEVDDGRWKRGRGSRY
jgi:hypothetical protein